MSRIRILAEAVANRIAAGEVIERPASVVKELVENALDAGARAIRVEVESGGRRLIRVSDDGCGMNHDDALLAFERHATSKLRTADDLLSIATLGFRGEALPSIASVSRLILETCERGETQNLERRSQNSEGGSQKSDDGNQNSAIGSRTAETATLQTREAFPTSDLRPPTSSSESNSGQNAEGVRVEFAGGRLLNVKPAGVPAGTAITVQDLFYCVPARRKFLKSDTTELGHIASLVTHYALAHPDKAFQLKTPTQMIVDAAPVATMAERVYQLFGRQALEEMVEMPEAKGPFRASVTEPALEPGEEGNTLRVTGFVSRPEVQRPNRNGIFVFVNQRLVRDRLILHAVHEAYRNIMPANAFPAVLLFLEMPPAEVDVNVHPAKIEVRFRHPNFVHDFTRDAVRMALTHARPIAAFPSTAGAPRPDASGPRDAGAPSLQGSAAAGAAPARAMIPNPSFPTQTVGKDGAPAPAPIAHAPGMSLGGFELTTEPQQPEAQRFAFEPGATMDFGTLQFAGAVPCAATGSENDGDPSWNAAPRPPASGQAGSAPTAARLPQDISELKPLGQVNNSFIIAVNGEGLWIIDQHVAHERVLFEQHLRARRDGALTGQRMLAPLLLELSPRQLVTLEQISEELTANGFEVTPMGARSVAVQATPAGVSHADAERLLMQILDGVEKEAEAISMDALQAKIAASTACHAAIKVNMPLDQTKMEWLLAELAKTEAPMSCPHGRPVVLRYSTREIEKAFKRT
ncbi:MAG: DNA mismatch repair endonuclease MutL [Candidatus Acidiferrales bacterium]